MDSYHENNILTKFSTRNKFCCDPYKLHKRKIDYGRLHEIDLSIAKKVKKCKDFDFIIIHGKRLCHNCFIKLSRELSNIDDNISEGSTFSKSQGSEQKNVPE